MDVITNKHESSRISVAIGNYLPTLPIFKKLKSCPVTHICISMNVSHVSVC